MLCLTLLVYFSGPKFPGDLEIAIMTQNKRDVINRIQWKFFMQFRNSGVKPLLFVESIYNMFDTIYKLGKLVIN